MLKCWFAFLRYFPTPTDLYLTTPLPLYSKFKNVSAELIPKSENSKCRSYMIIIAKGKKIGGGGKLQGNIYSIFNYLVVMNAIVRYYNVNHIHCLFFSYLS